MSLMKYSNLVKLADDENIQTPQSSETAAKIRKENKEISDTMTSPKAGPANSPEAQAKGTVPGLSQIAADQYAGSNSNGVIAAGIKDASSTNPLIAFLMPKQAGIGSVLGNAVKSTGYAPYAGTVGQGVKDVAKGIWNYGTPLAAAEATGLALNDSGAPKLTTGVESLTAGLLANPALMKSYWSKGLKHLAAEGVEPTAANKFDAFINASKAPMGAKLMLGGIGAIAPIQSAAMHANEMAQNAATASQQLPDIMKTVNKGVDKTLSGAANTVNWASQGMSDAAKSLKGIGGNIEKGTADFPAAGKAITESLQNVASGTKPLGELSSTIASGAKRLGPAIEPILRNIGEATSAGSGPGVAEQAGRFIKSQTDVNEAITTYGPKLVMGALAVGGLAAVAKLIEAMRHKHRGTKKKAEFNEGGLAEKEPAKAVKVMKEEPKEVESGKKVEKEHTNEPEKAKAIAADHLVEDRKYYTHLTAMEKAVKEEQPVAPAVKKAAPLTDAELEIQLRDKEASLTCETPDGKQLNVTGDAFELYKAARRDHNNLKALLALLETSDADNR